MSTDKLAERIWEASRADESTISATGAYIVAKAIEDRFVVIDRNDPPVVVDEMAVRKLADSLRATSSLGYVGSGQLARRLVADGWKREVTP